MDGIEFIVPDDFSGMIYDNIKDGENCVNCIHSEYIEEVEDTLCAIGGFPLKDTDLFCGSCNYFKK